MSVVHEINLKVYYGGILYKLYDALKGVDIESAYLEILVYIKWYNENHGTITQ